jgi:hypothetical protein
MFDLYVLVMRYELHLCVCTRLGVYSPAGSRLAMYGNLSRYVAYYCIFVVIFEMYVLVMGISYICLCTGLRYFFSPADGPLASTGMSPSRLYPIDYLFVCLICTCLMILNLYIGVCTRLGRLLFFA